MWGCSWACRWFDPIQILLVNLVTDGLPAMALGMDPAQDDVMEPPRSSEESIFRRPIGQHRLPGDAHRPDHPLYVCGLLPAVRRGGSRPHRRPDDLDCRPAFHVFECKSETHSLFGVPFFNNKKLIGAVMVSGGIAFLASENTWMRAIFQTIPLTLNQWLLVLGAS